MIHLRFWIFYSQVPLKTWRLSAEKSYASLNRPLLNKYKYLPRFIDLGSFNLVTHIVPLLEQLPDTTNIQPEYIQNSVEIASKPFTRIGGLDANLRDIVSELMDHTAALEIQLSGAGTHAFSTDLAVLNPMLRYQAMERYGYTLWIALSANSPYWRDVDTG